MNVQIENTLGWALINRMKFDIQLGRVCVTVLLGIWAKIIELG